MAHYRKSALGTVTHRIGCKADQIATKRREVERQLGTEERGDIERSLDRHRVALPRGHVGARVLVNVRP